jgi:hypothetical protein
MEAQSEAILNLRAGINISVSLPERLLLADYTAVYVMDFERLLHPRAIDMFKALIWQEKATVAAVGKLKEVGKETQGWLDDFFFVNQATANGDYEAFVYQNIMEFAKKHETPAMSAPWAIFAERIGASSDIGSWCIYGEKFAEIAILAFKQTPDPPLEKKLHIDFGVERLVEALKRDTFFGDPGNEYSEKQRGILRSAYL